MTIEMGDSEDKIMIDLVIEEEEETSEGETEEGLEGAMEDRIEIEEEEATQEEEEGTSIMTGEDIDAN